MTGTIIAVPPTGYHTSFTAHGARARPGISEKLRQLYLVIFLETLDVFAAPGLAATRRLPGSLSLVIHRGVLVDVDSALVIPYPLGL